MLPWPRQLVLIVSAGVPADPPRGNEAKGKTEPGKIGAPPGVRHVFPLRFVKANDLRNAIANLFTNVDALERALEQEESAERTADRAYWQPLKAEVEALRRSRRKPQV